MLLRLRSFWLGLPIFAFLVWCWVDSMSYDSRANWLSGPLITRKGKILERVHRPWESFSRQAPVLPQPSLELSDLPTERLPMSPVETPPLRIVDPLLEAPELRVQRCLSLGNKHGSIWWSVWETPPDMVQAWKRDKDSAVSTWFPGFQFQAGSEGGTTTLWLPHWLLLTGYGVMWGLLMGWRVKRRRSAASA